MCTELKYLLFPLLLFASCEEYYNPNIDVIEGQMVIEALITNDASKNFVFLSKTRSFYDKQPPGPVIGARVEFVEINGKVIQGIESRDGYFKINVIPQIGKNYKLRISVNKDTYESEIVNMPPMPVISEFYTGHIVKKEYRTNSYGVPVVYQVPGRELYVDAPVTADLSNYRFFTRVILQWIYSPPSMGPPPPTVYGWQSYYSNGQFNIAGPKKFSVTSKIEKQPLRELPYNADGLIEPDSIENGWIIVIDQYGTSGGSFEYHEKLNSQFAADGSLFDPVQTQVYGNIKCITDPSKVVYGYFDLNSYRQYRYFLRITSPDSPVSLRQIFRYPDIPEAGTTVEWPPDWWE